MNIPGVDTAKGVAMTGGTEEGYRAVLSVYIKDIEKRTLVLRKMPEAETLLDFTTQVHALKSASATIGASEVAARAAELETAARAGDIAFIQKNLNGFMETLAILENNVQAALDTEQSNVQEQTADDLLPLLYELEIAIKSKNVSSIDRLMIEINARRLDSKTKFALEEISDQLLVADFEKALISVKKFFQ